MTIPRTHADGTSVDVTTISPEIVLVDSELGRRLRRRLPIPRPRIRPPLPVLHASVEDEPAASVER